MDTLTHALSGALIARATTPRRPRQGDLPLGWRMITGSIAATFPDIDFALRLVDTITYLNQHQGLSHSLLMMPVWALLLSWLMVVVSRGRYRWSAFFVPALLGLSIHIAADLITSYGLMLFAPLSDQRYSLPLAFVFDPWFTGIIVAGLLLAWRWPAQRVIPIAALGCLVGYTGFLASQHYEARSLAQAHARQIDAPQAEIDVLPQPLSPFHWKLVVRDGDHYHLAHTALRPSHFAALAVRLPGLPGALHERYRPGDALVWQYTHRFGPTEQRAFAARAWQQQAFAPFRDFSALPVLLDVTEDERGRCAWFVDLRFVFPGLPPSFRYGTCQHSGEWSIQRLRGSFWID